LLFCIAVQAGARRHLIQTQQQSEASKEVLGAVVLGECSVTAVFGRHLRFQRVDRSEDQPRGGFRVPQYCAFGIGPEELATSVHEFDARDDAEALEKALPHFHDGLKRVEIWCGSRKVGDVTPQKKVVPASESIRGTA
jgi:hypothetical protein